MFTLGRAIKGQSAIVAGTHDRRRTRKKKHLAKESNNKLMILYVPSVTTSCNHCSLKPQLSI